MKTDLDHLPEKKRRELQRIQEILFEEFALAKGDQQNREGNAGTHPEAGAVRLLCAWRLGRRGGQDRQGIPERFRSVDRRQPQGLQTDAPAPVNATEEDGQQSTDRITAAYA